MNDPAKLQELLSKADKRAYCVVLSVALLVLSYAFLFPVLFGLEVDGTIDAPFALVFAPLWVVYALGLAAFVTAVCRGPSTRPEELEEGAEWEDGDPLLHRQLGLAFFLLFVGCQAVIVAKLDGGLGEEVPWSLALLPYYVFEVAQIVQEGYFTRRSELAAAASLDAQGAAKAAAAASDVEARMSGALGFEERMEAEQHREHAAMAAGAACYYAARLAQVGHSL